MLYNKTDQSDFSWDPEKVNILDSFQVVHH